MPNLSDIEQKLIADYSGARAWIALNPLSSTILALLLGIAIGLVA